MPSATFAKLIKSNKEDNTKLVALIEKNLNKLIKDLGNISDDLLKSELEKIEYTVEKKININECLNMLDLETEESAEQRRDQKGQELKILTPKQMLSSLPIYLAQFRAGNNSEKLKNEKRQLLYSLNRSENLSKTII